VTGAGLDRAADVPGQIRERQMRGRPAQHHERGPHAERVERIEDRFGLARARTVVKSEDDLAWQQRDFVRGSYGKRAPGKVSLCENTRWHGLIRDGCNSDPDTGCRQGLYWLVCPDRRSGSRQIELLLLRRPGATSNDNTQHHQGNGKTWMAHRVNSLSRIESTFCELWLTIGLPDGLFAERDRSRRCGGNCASLLATRGDRC
jgi:hypothetical protein